MSACEHFRLLVEEGDVRGRQKESNEGTKQEDLINSSSKMFRLLSQLPVFGQDSGEIIVIRSKLFKRMYFLS